MRDRGRKESDGEKEIILQQCMSWSLYSSLVGSIRCQCCVLKVVQWVCHRCHWGAVCIRCHQGDIVVIVWHSYRCHPLRRSHIDLWTGMWSPCALELQGNGGKKKRVIGFQNEQSGKIYVQLWNPKEACLKIKTCLLSSHLYPTHIYSLILPQHNFIWFLYQNYPVQFLYWIHTSQ